MIPLGIAIVYPLILLLVMKRTLSPFVLAHLKEALNLQLIIFIMASVLCITPLVLFYLASWFGISLYVAGSLSSAVVLYRVLPAILIIDGLLTLFAMYMAGRGKVYRHPYPGVLRIIRE